MGEDLAPLLDRNDAESDGAVRLSLRTRRPAGGVTGPCALGAKLTGSGGGGSVIALAQSAEDNEGEVANRIVGAWKSAGFDGFAARVRKSVAPASPSTKPEERTP